ncbi:hypothetical protein ACFV99_38535 [Streptomyces sp. NPDC059944]
MSESSTVQVTDHPIPRERPDQQATESDPLDIATMVRHARRAAASSPATV